MTFARRCAAAAALAAALATPATAELTAQGLYDLWQGQGAEQGRSVTAGRVENTESGLVLRNLSVVQEIGSDALRLTVPVLPLDEAAGAVTATLAAGQMLTVTLTESDGTRTTAEIEVTEGPLTLTAEGAETAPDYAIAAAALRMALRSLEGPDVAEDAAWSLDVGGLSGTLAGGSDAAPLTADLSLMRFSTDLAGTDPASGQTVMTSLAQNAVTMALALVPGSDEGEDWAFDLRSMSGPSTTTTRQTGGGDGDVVTESRQASTRVTLALSDGRATYATAATGLDVVVQAEEMPLSEVQFSAAAADLALSLPTAPGPTAQSARVRILMEALTLNEAVWSLVDPAGALPREPATLVLDVAGDVLVSEDVGLPSPDGLPGVLPTTLDIDTLSLDFAGAQLDAEGAFRTVIGPGGAPDLAEPPVGALTVVGRGISTFLERLTAGGMMTADQAMGMQMMLGMFTTQRSDGALETRIETTPGGGLIVNGNQLR